MRAKFRYIGIRVRDLDRSLSFYTKLYGMSGRVKRPGIWELPMGTTVREILEEHAGGMRDGVRLRGLLPGGASTDFLTEEHLDVKMDFTEVLEAHDSFYIGSDVFYTYLVRNGCWRIRRDQRSRAGFLAGVGEARRRILAGTFPPAIVEQVVAMLEYFGQSPLIVRSSSLLEDNYGNAFSGKYESVFCANQGTPQERLQAFMNASW